MRRRVWTLAIGLAAVFAAWFTVRRARLEWAQAANRPDELMRVPRLGRGMAAGDLDNVGPALVVDRVEVRWPSGHRDCYQGVAANAAGYRLVEGDPAPRPLAGFSSATIPR